MRHLGTLAGLVALGSALLLATPSGAVAQESGFPPFPVLMTGEVYVDGDLLAEPGTITARVDDWESRPVEVTNGRFGDPPGIPIVIGPPSFDYVGQLVTFHLNGELQADLSFVFEARGEPAFLDARLEFGAPRQLALATPTPTPGSVPAPTEAGRPAGPTLTPAEAGPDGTSGGVWVLVGAAAGLVGLATAFGLRARRR